MYYSYLSICRGRGAEGGIIQFLPSSPPFFPLRTPKQQKEGSAISPIDVSLTVHSIVQPYLTKTRPDRRPTAAGREKLPLRKTSPYRSPSVPSMAIRIRICLDRFGIAPGYHQQCQSDVEFDPPCCALSRTVSPNHEQPRFRFDTLIWMSTI